MKKIFVSLLSLSVLCSCTSDCYLFYGCKTGKGSTNANQIIPYDIEFYADGSFKDYAVGSAISVSQVKQEIMDCHNWLITNKYQYSTATLPYCMNKKGYITDTHLKKCQVKGISKNECLKRKIDWFENDYTSGNGMPACKKGEYYCK